MALTQATNIIPSIAGAGNLASGIVDARKGLHISWQVNGNSPMVAYQLTIYLNDSASTPKYSTGRVALTNPFYGKDALGNPQFFDFTIPMETLADHGIINGGEYKFILTQWWSDTQSITQASAAAFRTRKTPTLTMGAIPAPVPGNSFTFTANYAQEQGDEVDQVRWQIANTYDLDNPLYDSGQLFTQTLSCSYDRFLPAADESIPNYAVKCTVQTVNGVEVSTGWVAFVVFYPSSEQSWLVSTKCYYNYGCVKISWPLISYIPGSATGTYTVSGGKLSLQSGANIVWDSVNGASMSFINPWSLLWKGTISSAADLVVVGGNTPIKLSYDGAETLALYAGETVIKPLTGVASGDIINVVITRNLLCWRRDHGGVVTTGRWNISYSQDFVTSITVNGPQSCDYVQLLDGDPSEAVIQSAWYDPSWEPDFGIGSELLAKFDSGIGGGVVQTPITGFVIYRQNVSTGEFLHVAEFSPTETAFWDYGVRNESREYIWYVYAKNADTYLLRIKTEPIVPSFWDWIVLSCSEDSRGFFAVQKSFYFGKNLSTTSITNGNEPGTSSNFTPYPSVLPAPQNYQTGSLTSLIGVISRYGKYSDSRGLRDEIWGLSTTDNALFLKNRKGDLLRIRVSGEIGMDTGDNTMSQTQTATIPWVEIGSADGASICSTIDPGECVGGYGSGYTTQQLIATTNGRYDVPDGIDGYAPVIVNVPTDAIAQKLVVTENGEYIPPYGIDGYAPVEVSVHPTLKRLDATENGTFYPPEGYDAFSYAIVNVSGGSDPYLPVGDVAEMTVDRLSTSKRVREYLLDTMTRPTPLCSDDNYVQIQDQFNSLRTGTVIKTAGIPQTKQEANRLGQPLFWQSRPISTTVDGYPLDAEGHQIYTTTTPTEWPVIVYQYDELTKLQMNFEHDGSNYVPKIVLGAGDPQGNAKGYLWKDAHELRLQYLTSSGTMHELVMGNDGVTLNGVSVELDGDIPRIGGIGIQVVDDYPTVQASNVLYIKTGS